MYGANDVRVPKLIQYKFISYGRLRLRAESFACGKTETKRG